MTVNNAILEAYIAALAEETTPDVNADMLLLLDVSTGAMKKIKPNTVASGMSAGVGADGWAAADAMTYAAADDPTFTLTITGDQSAKYSVGMRIKLTQTTVKYFIITAVTVSTDTTLTLYGGTDYDLANAAITSPYYSSAKAPLGFPLDPSKWTVQVSDTSSRQQNSPNTATWYNLGSVAISIPVGVWRVSYSATIQANHAGTGNITAMVALSTGNNSASDTELIAQVNANAINAIDGTVYREKFLTLAAKTSYYLNLRAPATAADVYSMNDVIPAILRAVCAYL